MELLLSGPFFLLLLFRKREFCDVCNTRLSSIEASCPRFCCSKIKPQVYNEVSSLCYDYVMFLKMLCLDFNLKRTLWGCLKCKLSFQFPSAAAATTSGGVTSQQQPRLLSSLRRCCSNSMDDESPAGIYTIERDISSENNKEMR